MNLKPRVGKLENQKGNATGEVVCFYLDDIGYYKPIPGCLENNWTWGRDDVPLKVVEAHQAAGDTVLIVQYDDKPDSEGRADELKTTS